MYVKCQAGCISLFPEEAVDFPPPDGEDEYYEGGALDGTKRGGGSKPCEGGDAKASEYGYSDLPF